VVIANTTPLPNRLLRRYLTEGGTPWSPRPGRIAVRRAGGGPAAAGPEAEMARHHPVLLNRAIREVIATL